MSAVIRFIPLFTLIVIWVISITFSPVEDFEYTYFDGFIDAFLGSGEEVGMFRRIIGGLPVAILVALTIAYTMMRRGDDGVSHQMIRCLALLGFIVNAVYGLVILAADVLYSGLMHFSREKARTEWNTHVDAGVVDELALIFYWFNIALPLLYLLFRWGYRRLVLAESSAAGVDD